MRDAAEDIAVRAVQAYINVLRDRDIIMLGEANVAKHREVHEKVTERFESGAGSEVDVFQADSRLALPRTGCASSAAICGFPRPTFSKRSARCRKISEVPANPADAVPATEEDGVNTAWDNNPEIKSAAAIVESRRDDIDVARSPYLADAQPRGLAHLGQGRRSERRGIGNTTEVILRLRYTSTGAAPTRRARRAPRSARARRCSASSKFVG